ncbi:MAG: phage portal protein [Deltaproteobacteria bacterium]|nr:phage portal protein [Deltaproteobacteria bacterium]
MAIFPFGRKSKKSQEVVFTPTFFPLEWVNAFLADGLNANQKKFLKLYLSTPELQAVINYKARVFSGLRVKAVDNNDKEVPNPQAGLFERPNPLQNFKEFASQYYILRAIFGNEFIHPIFGNDRTKTQTLWNLPPMNAEVLPVKNGLVPFNMTSIDELVAGYRFWYDGKPINYEPKEIIHYNDNQVQFDKDKILLGDSKLRPLVQACENIQHAYEARGIIIQNSALGILSNETTDVNGTTDMDPEEKERVQKAYKGKYGLVKGKDQIIVTNASLKWQPLEVNIAKLKLFEEVEADFKTICNAHNFPTDILINATYENKQKAIAQLYQEAVIPEFDEWLSGYANWAGLSYRLKADYSHISVLQMDKERASKSLNYAATGLAKAKESGLIDENEAKETFKKFLP